MTDAGASIAADSDVGDLLAGWDVAYVTSLSAMNDALRAQNIWPRNITVEATDGSKQVLRATIAGISLAVDTKAVGGNVVLAIELQNATVSGRSYCVKDYVCTADAELEFCPIDAPHPDSRLSQIGSGNSPFLIKKLTGMSSVRLRDPDPDIITDDDLLEAIATIQDILQVWLDGELLELALIFAAAMPGLKDLAGKDSPFGWSLPAGLAYAVAQPYVKDGKLPPEQACVFALLGVSDPEGLARLQPQIVPESLPPGADAAYIISTGILLSSIIGPAILAALGATNSPTLIPTDRGNGITNSTSISLPDIDLSKVSGTTAAAQWGSNVRIDPENLLIEIRGDALTINVLQMDFTTAEDFENVQLYFSFQCKLDDSVPGKIRLAMPDKYTGGAEFALTDKAVQSEMWSKLVVAIIGAALAFIPGGEAEVEVTEGAEEAGTVSLTGTADATEQTVIDAPEVAAQADKELAGAAPSLGSFAATAAKKIGITVGIAVGQEILTDWPNLLTKYQDLRKAGDIDNWTSALNGIVTQVAARAWFGADSGKSIHCTGAELNDGLIVHLAFGSSEIAS